MRTPAPIADKVEDSRAASVCSWCERSELVDLAEFHRPLAGEKSFGIALDQFQRTVWRCLTCGHYGNRHRHDAELTAAYGGDYHADAHGASMALRFAHLMAMPASQSDNRQRVADLLDDLRRLGRTDQGRLLDVGSGTAVFGAVMHAAGWRVTALDPDPAAARHAREVAGIDAIVGDLASVSFGKNSMFDLVTFNKVLEHLPPALALKSLQIVRDILTPNGLVYLELPDGEMAARLSIERQEFFLEHYGAFSPASTIFMGRRADLTLLMLRRLVEPSGKLTLRAIFAKSDR